MQGAVALVPAKRFPGLRRWGGMLTSTRREGRRRIVPSPLGRPEPDGDRTRSRLPHPGTRPGRVAGRRVGRWLTTTVALTLLGVTGAAVLVISPLAAWRVPVEFAGLALIGLSVVALLWHAVRP